MKSINIYLNFPGNTEEAFNFYKKIFKKDFSALMRFSDTPENQNLPEQDRNKIMHIALPLSPTLSIMATDALESMGQKLQYGNNSYIIITTESKQEADQLFNELSAGGEAEMPMQDTFWNAYFGSLKDKFGVLWMINFDYGN